MATSPLWRSSTVDRERLSWETHKLVARGSDFPPPKVEPQGTFLHGFLLPFSLIGASLRHQGFGLVYLRVTMLRGLAVVVAALVVVAGAALFKRDLGPDDLRPRITYSKTSDPDADGVKHKKTQRFRGVKFGGEKSAVEVTTDDEETDIDPDGTTKPTNPEPPAEARWFVRLAKNGWAWLAWLVGFITTLEALVVTVSRRWDDWIGYHVSWIARVRPEDPTPPTPKIVLFEPGWMLKKLRRRIRGYIVIAAGIPLVALFRLVPSIGGLLFAVGLTLGSWYWLGVFTAAKSAHAWADDAWAPPPVVIRELRDRSAPVRLLRPVNFYARVLAFLSRGVNAPASVFERSPRPFLGLALARVILSLPGLYVLARPILPVAAGRLCAENDPQNRFSL